METIFDLQQGNDSWAEEVNQALQTDISGYQEKYGLVGSAQWWDQYNNDLIPHEIVRGKIHYIGERTDEFNEVYEVVEVRFLTGTRVFACKDYWESPKLDVGKEIEIETFEVVVQQSYGPIIFEFEKALRLTD